MSDLYVLTTPGPIPVTLAEAKPYLKIPPAVEADDDLLTLYLTSAADFAEKYTRRELRVNTWTLFTDAFLDRICLRRDPIDSITSVTYLDDADTPAQQVVADTVYYLKKGVQASEVLLLPDQSWPTDVNLREHAIEIEFDTEPHRCLDQAKLGILRHVAFMYENRGDCDPENAADSAKRSGASALYDQFRVSRV